MNSKQKIDRIVARNPELKETFISLQDQKVKSVLHTLVDQKRPKVAIIGRDSDKLARLYELSMVINLAYPHITEHTTVELLDMYVGREDDGIEQPSLSSVVDDVVIIHDSRAFVPNKQKSNMIMQVFEQNTHVIYYYKGSHKSFIQEHPQLIEYLKDNSIPKVNSDTAKQVYDKEEVI